MMKLNTISNEKTIPSNITISDIHMHVIPGVDDGSESLDMSMEMLRCAYVQGVRDVFCTSHGAVYLDEECGKIAKRNYIELVGRCRADLPELELHLGAEIIVVQAHIDKLIDRLNNKLMPTLADSKYVLVEFYNGLYFEEVVENLNKLLNAGYIPIIAHIEKYSDIFIDVDSVKEIQNMGCLVQINCNSIVGEINVRTTKFANRLLDKHLVDFIGSDAHKTFYRAPSYKDGVQELYNRYDKKYVDKILYKNARELILGIEEEKVSYDLRRFRNAHEMDYNVALSEIKAGRKRSHWMWYIFPQIYGLGSTSTSQYYSIKSVGEARAYYEDEILGDHMDVLCDTLLNIESSDAEKVFGYPDNLKLKSSMTLFHLAVPEEKRFIEVLNKFYDGELDQRTIDFIS